MSNYFTLQNFSKITFKHKKLKQPQMWLDLKAHSLQKQMDFSRKLWTPPVL